MILSLMLTTLLPPGTPIQIGKLLLIADPFFAASMLVTAIFAGR
jgi:hypothetical protein